MARPPIGSSADDRPRALKQLNCKRLLLRYTVSAERTICWCATGVADEETLKMGTNQRYPVEKSAEEWRRELTSEQFHVLREHGTELAGTSVLNHEHRQGVFHCGGCGAPLFETSAKFDSGTGWPSFYEPIDGAVATSEDDTYGMRRIEVHCVRCGGHLGHLFADGPAPTGLRYCTNGAALAFEPSAADRPVTDRANR
jgi:peptide-methionine (R)-S-oxide reductase